MIVEWFVGFLELIAETILGFLPPADALDLPDFGPAFGIMRAFDVATSGVIGETFIVIGVVLSVMAVLFTFGLVRQLWRFVPFIGGG